MNNPLNLYPHNWKTYQLVKEKFETGEKIVGIVHATGTGKSYIALNLALDNQDKKIIYVVPSLAILEHLQEIIDENKNVHAADFSHVDFRTYQSFVNMSSKEIENLECNILITDEFHHFIGPVWGSRVSSIIETHPDIQVFGMTAYTVARRGTTYERDMALDGGREIFSDKIVSKYDLCDAMIEGVLPKLNYKSAYTNLNVLANDVEKEIDKNSLTSSRYKAYLSLLKDLKRRVHEAPSIADVLKENLKPNGKYFYFCPANFENGVNDIETIKAKILSDLKPKFQEEDVVFYTTTTKMGELGKKNRDAFYHDKTLDGIDCSNKLRIMFAINQYNEGVHAPNVDGIIEGRVTNSDIIYFEHLGRALSVRGDTREEYKKLEKYSEYELAKMCYERNILVDENSSKEEKIEKLLSPVIIDLACNYEFIKELEDHLVDRIYIRDGLNKSSCKRKEILNSYFDIKIENIDLFNTLVNLKKKFTHSWEEMYEYARIYYEYHGNLNVPLKFKTSDGYTYDETGVINLGKWLAYQRREENPDTERGKLLLEIGINFNNRQRSWEEIYQYACIYYEYYGNLEVPTKFKTNDGYTYDKMGNIPLGEWLKWQRRTVLPDSERGKLLTEIKFRFENKKNTLSWEEMYEYARIYYKYHGNLEVPLRFNTNNGYEYEKNGKIHLGLWIQRQKRNEKLSQERRVLLKKLNMNFQMKSPLGFEKTYKYACLYYQYHGNLNIPDKYKTNDGYTYDDLGEICLGSWLTNQKQFYQKKEMPEEQIILLENIGIQWMSEKVDNKLQKEEITEENTRKKQIELLNRTKSLLNHIGNQNFKSREDIDRVNQKFVDELNRKSR